MWLTYEQYCQIFGEISRDEYDDIHAHPLTEEDLPNIEKLYIVIVPKEKQT